MRLILFQSTLLEHLDEVNQRLALVVPQVDGLLNGRGGGCGLAGALMWLLVFDGVHRLWLLGLARGYTVRWRGRHIEGHGLVGAPVWLE